MAHSGYEGEINNIVACDIECLLICVGVGVKEIIHGLKLVGRASRKPVLHSSVEGVPNEYVH